MIFPNLYFGILLPLVNGLNHDFVQKKTSCLHALA